MFPASTAVKQVSIYVGGKAWGNIASSEKIVGKTRLHTLDKNVQVKDNSQFTPQHTLVGLSRGWNHLTLLHICLILLKEKTLGLCVGHDAEYQPHHTVHVLSYPTRSSEPCNTPQVLLRLSEILADHLWTIDELNLHAQPYITAGNSHYWVRLWGYLLGS